MQLDFGAAYSWRAWVRNVGDLSNGIVSGWSRSFVATQPFIESGLSDLGWNPNVDMNDQQTEDSGVNGALGTFTNSITDASVASVAPGLVVSRTYNARNRKSGVFGPGWTSSLGTRLDFVPTNGTTATATDPVLITMPDGRREYFTRNSNGEYKPSGDGTYADLAFNPLATTTFPAWGGFRYATKDGSVTAWFDTNGRLEAIRDRNGNRLVYSYNGSNQLTQITDEKSGRGLTISYYLSGTSLGLVQDVKTISVAAHGGQLTWSYSYTPARELQQVCPPVSTVPSVTGCWNYAYTDGRLVQITNPASKVEVEVAYDTTSFTIGAGNLVANPSFENAGSWTASGVGAGSGIGTSQSAWAGSQSYVLNYGGAGSNAELLSSPINVTAGKQYTVSARIKAPATGGSTGKAVPYVYFYDQAGAVIKSVPATFGGEQTWPTTTAWTWVRGQFLVPEVAKTVKVAFQWPSAQGHNGTVAVDAVIVEQGDGKVGRVVSKRTAVDIANGKQTAYAYNNLGFDTEVIIDDATTDPTLAKDVYNEKFQLTSSVDKAGLSTKYEYDTNGFVNKITDPANRVTTRVNNVRGDKISETKQWLNRTEYWSYWTTTNGVLTSLLWEYRDARSSSATDNTYRTKYEYDLAGNLTKITDPLNSFESRTYADATTPAATGTGLTPRGSLMTVTDRTSVTVSYGYDALGNQVRITDPAKGITVQTFDEIGRVLDHRTRLERDHHRCHDERL